MPRYVRAAGWDQYASSNSKEIGITMELQELFLLYTDGNGGGRNGKSFYFYKWVRFIVKHSPMIKLANNGKFESSSFETKGSILG